MPFKSKKELGGKLDPNINNQGRIEKQTKPTAKQIKQKEFLSLLRKLKPLLAKSVNAASKIIDNPDSSEAAKLKAAALLMSTYKDLIKEVYDVDIIPDGDSADEVQDSAPVFSLKMLGDESKD